MTRTLTAPPERGHDYPPSAVPSLVAVLEELDRSPIRYCLWKSNFHLDAALGGKTDLDLLVEGDASAAMREIFDRHGLKALVPAPGAAYPGMEHFLGMDRGTGRMFHLHVHYQLVLGEKYVKNYRIPIERQFLDATRTLHGVPVPHAALDLSMLSVRALLKYRVRDLVKDTLRIRSPGIPEDIQQEIAWLRDSTSAPAIRESLHACSGYIDPLVVLSFLDVVSDRPRAGRELFRLRGRLRRGLRAQQRRHRWVASVDYFTNLLRRRRRFRRRAYEPRMTPARGGLTVAFIGADGSGKSTVTLATQRWLQWKLDARIHYMGSKDPSRASRWSYVAFRALRRANRSVGRRPDGGVAIGRATTGLRDVMLAAHHLSTARDRARRQRLGERQADSGSIVLFDRYPIGCFSGVTDHRLLDGPQIASVLDGSMTWATSLLACVEEAIYRRYPRPDVLFVLLADADVAVARKPDHDSSVIARKRRAAGEIADLAEAQGGRVLRVDANQPLDEVLLAVKAGLWDAI